MKILLTRQIRFLINLYNQIGTTAFNKPKLILINKYSTDLICTIRQKYFHLFIRICYYHSLLLLKQVIDITTSELICTSVFSRPKLLIYHFRSQQFTTSLTIHTLVERRMYSVCALYQSAEGLEREIFDTFGIFFNGNKTAQHIICDFGFTTPPTIKEFPMLGYAEMAYNEKTKRIEQVKIDVTGELRAYRLKDEWKAAIKTKRRIIIADDFDNA